MKLWNSFATFEVLHCVHRKVSSVFFDVTLAVVHKFLSNLACSYSNKSCTVCMKTVHFSVSENNKNNFVIYVLPRFSGNGDCTVRGFHYYYIVIGGRGGSEKKAGEVRKRWRRTDVDGIREVVRQGNEANARRTRGLSTCWYMFVIANYLSVH